MNGDFAYEKWSFPFSRLYDKRVSQPRNTKHLSHGSNLGLRLKTPDTLTDQLRYAVGQNGLLVYMYSKTALKDLEIKTTRLIGP